jgi:hypothetical protein
MTRKEWRRMKRLIVSLAALVLVLIVARVSAGEIMGASNVAAQAKSTVPQIPQLHPDTRQAVSFDESPPLRSIPPAYNASAKQEAERENWMKPRSQVANFVSVDPVVQHSFGASAMPTPILTFKGYTQHDNAATGPLIFWPPDTEGDVGLNHYFQWNNVGLKIFDKAGNLIYGPVPGNTLFQGMTGPGGTACSGTNSGDPIVLYDTMADRWLASQFTTETLPSGPTYECIAISKTGDPTGQYYRYAFQASPTTDPSRFEDYPHFGVWPDAYYMTTNEFDVGPSGDIPPIGFVGAGNFAFERAEMLVGNPAARMVYFHLDPPYGGMLPSDLDGPNNPPAGSPNYFVEVDDEFGEPAADQLSIFKFHVDWSNVLSSTFTGPTTVPVAAFDPGLCEAERGACIPQPDTKQMLESITDRLMYRLAYRNFGDHESLVVNHTVDADGTGHAGIRWYELRSPGTSPTIHQQGTYAPDASHRWMGSISMDGDGNIALGYSVSNATDVYPSIRYTGRLAGDPLGQLPQGEATLYAGLGSQTANARWGDYSMMGIDPSDDCSFWYTQEYYGATGDYWLTRIGKFRFPTCGGGAIPTETPIPAPDPCTLPGVIVETDPTGDVADILGGGGTEQDKYDAQYISVAEPYTGTGPDHLVFTLKVVSLDGPENDPATSPNSFWRIFFSTPATTTLSFVDMRTSASGVVTFKYGTGTGTTVGDADDGSYSHDGSIRITIADSKLGVGPGDTLTGIYSRVSNGAIFAENVNYPEPDISVAYTIHGNAFCQFGGGATPTPIVVPTACPIQFADVPSTGEGSTFYSYVRCLACRQIVSGYPCGDPGETCNGSNQPYYRPSANVSRGQLSKIVANSAGLNDPVAQGQQQFADVEPGDPFYLYVERLAQTGAIAGYPCDTEGEGCDSENRPYFRPTNPATRGQISKIVSIAAGFDEEVPEDQQTFTDVPTDSPFWVYIERLSSREIISGYGDEDMCPTGTPCFRYNDLTSRGQMAKIAANAFFPNCQTPARR